MRRILLSLLVLPTVAGLTDPVIEACGSKFLVGSKAARYQRMQAVSNPATILVYWRQDADTPAEDRWDPEFESVLENVGYTTNVTTDADAFRNMVGKGDSHIVMIKGLDEARMLRGDVKALSPDSAILPFVYFPTRSELSQAKKDFDHVLKLPATMRQFLSVVEKSRKSRER